MQYYNNVLAVEANWLVDAGVMSKPNYDQLRARRDIQVIRRGCRGQEALVAYESMPERFKRKVQALIPNPYKVVEQNMVGEHMEHSAEVASFFDGYTIGDDRHLPADKRREYYANAIVLNAINRLICLRAAKRRALGHTAVRFWESISDAVQNLDKVQFPHALPANARSLERKYKQYMSEGCESLIHKAYLAQHKNAAKVSSEEQESILAVLISDPRNIDNEQVARIYNMTANAMNWKKITGSTVAVWRDKLESISYARRHGKKEFEAKKAMQVKRVAPSYPLYYWTMDGWDIELMYQQQTCDKDGHSKTTYYNRLTMVVILDACCKYPIGYAIGTHETPELIKEALRNAAKHTEQLFGQMYRVQQLQSDHYGKGNLDGLYQQMSDKYTPAKVGNAKAKIIEPWFRYFNKKYCQLQKNWSGFGVTSRKELQPNVDFINKFKADFPDFAGACAQVVQFLEMERKELHDEYVRLYNEMPESNRIALPYDQYLMLFGSDNGKRQLLQGNGLTLTIGGQKHQYDCFDHRFRDYASTRWQVRYDPDDMQKVLAVNEDETLRFVLEEKYTQPMALIERKEGDSAELQRILTFNSGLVERNGGRLAGYQQTALDMMNSNKELETLQKLLIVDSHGQHKNLRNKERLQLQAADIEDARTETDIYDEY